MARLVALWLGFGVVGLAWASVLVTMLTAGLFLICSYAISTRQRWSDLIQMRQIGIVALPLMLNNLLMQSSSASIF